MHLPFRILSLASACLTLACTSNPAPAETDGTESSTTQSDSTGPTPVTMTTGPADTGETGGTGTSSSSGDTLADTSSSGDTTMGVDSTSDSSSGDSSSSGGPIPCASDEDCGSNQICSERGECADACGDAWAEGAYTTCLNEYGATDVESLCGADPHICIIDVYPIGNTTCSRQACTTVCDCPAPGSTGDATVTCEGITGDDVDDCYLSCADGETCPDDMICFGGYLCMEPVATEVPLYGNCGGLIPDCAAPSFCLDTGSTSVCQQDCMDAGDCPAPPPTGDAPVTCGEANAGNAGNECYLDCSGGDLCPLGMYCYDGYICAF